MSFNRSDDGRNPQSDDTNLNLRSYNPYKELPYQNPANRLYHLPTQPEYLFQEESERPHRSWGENLTYYTGIGYLSGAVSGAGKGFVDGVKSFEYGDTFKLRVNRILNSSGSTGRQWGNRTGVVALMFAGIENGIIAGRGCDDVWNSVASGLATGAIYKAASGPRAAAVAGAIGGVAVGVAVAVKQVAKRYIPV